MKRIRLSMGVMMLLVLLVSAYSRVTQSGTIKKETVTAQTIASQPAGKPYVIDLTRKGTDYEVAANVASQVRIRSAKGEIALSDLIREMELTGSMFLLTASPGGGTITPPNVVSRATQNGNGTLAACKGASTGKDCTDLTNSGLCSGMLVCGTLGSGWGKGKDGVQYGGQKGCGCTTKKYGKV